MPPRRKKPTNKSTPTSCYQTSPVASTSRSSGRNKTLPFTLEEAARDPEKHRMKVTRTVWEEQVCLPLMNERYAKEEPMDWTKEICYFHTHAEDQLARIYEHGVLIARLHRNITEAALEDYYLGGSFEGWWKNKMSESAQRNLLEVALDAASNAGGGYGFGIRLNCPDLTISAMLRDKGLGFISLLRQIVQSAQAFKQQEDYYPIVSEEFDRYYQIDREGTRDMLPQDRAVRSFQVIVQHDRMWFISMFVSSVLRSLRYDHNDSLNGSLLYKPRPTPLRPVNRGRQIVVETSSNPQTRREAQEVHDNVSMTSNDYLPGMFIGDPQDYKALRSSPLDACHCCRRVGAEVKELKEKGKQGKMFYCAKCLKLNPPHRFAYCSADCQKHDFKHGGHKKICGKLFADLALPPMGWEMPPSYPPLSTTLQYQLFTIEKDGFTPPYHKVYHVRYYIDGPPHPNGPDDTPISWNRRCACSMVFDRTEFDKLLNRAIATTSEKDIKAIVTDICERVRSIKPEVLDDAIRHCADDWDLEESKVRDWIEESAQREVLEEVCDIFKETIINERGGRRSNSVGDKVPEEFVREMFKESPVPSRSQSAPPRSKQES